MNQIPTISVGIMSRKEINFDLRGNFTLKTGELLPQGSYFASLSQNSICIKSESGQEFSSDEVLFLPSNPEVCEFELKDVTIGVNFHWEQNENQRFYGQLKFIVEDEQITAVNILPIENYLISVISSEMSATSSLELLKAHAIISRSWLIAQIDKQGKLSQSAQKYNSITETPEEYIRWYDREDHLNFHVCADDHCQRYQGTTRAQNPNVVKAVTETAGVILSYNGEVCDARFSKCCGGIAELFENCWEPVNHPYLTNVIDFSGLPAGFETDLCVEHNATQWIQGKPEAFCNTNDEEVLRQVLNEYDWSAKDFYRWTVEYSQDQLSELIARRSGRQFGQVIDMVPVLRGTSGRLIKLKIIGTEKTLTVGKELEIRRWLSESHLYSSAFTVEKENLIDGVPQKFVLRGAGWGHGAGLCQIGAAVMGHKGYSHNDILLHYFRNASLEKRY